MRNVYTVKQVNAYVKNMFAQDFMLNRIYVKGEVSNLKYHTSGHIYFSLKDESGTIACVMFAGQRSGLSFRMQEGQQVIFSVTDRGPGMSQDVQRHIFDKFDQGDPSRKQEGTGLGLPLAKRIVQLCSGAIAVNSQPGEGSTFTVTLPV